MVRPGGALQATLLAASVPAALGRRRGSGFLTPFLALGARLRRGNLGSLRADLAIRSSAALVLSEAAKVGAAQVPALNRPRDVRASGFVESPAAGSGMEALRAAAAHARLERLAAPEAQGGHGRAAKAQSAHTRAASRMTVAGSRIMLGPRRWREAEPDCPASRQRRAGPRRPSERQCGQKRGRWWRCRPCSGPCTKPRPSPP
jgi:hypothetical protein